MEMEIPVIVTDETEKSTSNVACGMPKCQAIRLCVCKLSDRHNQQLDQHISTPEGNGFQGRNYGIFLAATSAMVGRICPPWLG